MLLWTLSKKWPPPLPPPPSRSPMNFPTDKSSPSETNVSVAQKLSSNHPSWVWNLAAFTRPSTTPSWSATSISERTCTPTLSCPEVPPCTQVLPTECKRKSLPWPHPPSKSRSLLPQSENTPYGSEDPSWLPCPPSNRCGSPNKNTTSPAQELSTENAFKRSSVNSNYFNQTANKKKKLAVAIIIIINNKNNIKKKKNINNKKKIIKFKKYIKHLLQQQQEQQQIINRNHSTASTKDPKI